MWHAMFSLPLPASEKVLRAVLIYAFLVLAFRVAGKRELGQFTTLDLTVLLLIANAVQNGVIGADNSVTGAAIGAATLIAVDLVLARLTYRSDLFTRLLEGSPSTLICDGKPDMQALRHENIALSELRAIARRQGFSDLGEVDHAILETNGVVSMFRKGEQGRYHPDLPATAGA